MLVGFDGKGRSKYFSTFILFFFILDVHYINDVVLMLVNDDSNIVAYFILAAVLNNCDYYLNTKNELKNEQQWDYFIFKKDK